MKIATLLLTQIISLMNIYLNKLEIKEFKLYLEHKVDLNSLLISKALNIGNGKSQINAVLTLIHQMELMASNMSRQVMIQVQL